MAKTRHATTPAATRRPPLEAADGLARESDFWKFVGAVAIPMTGVALFALVVGLAPRLALQYDPTLSVQPSAGGSPVAAIPRERLRAIDRQSLGDAPPVPEAPTEPSAVAPFPVVPPFPLPDERPPAVTAQRDEPPGRIDPEPLPAEPLPAEQAQSQPPDLERTAPAAGPDTAPGDMAALPRVVPPTPEPPTAPAPTREAPLEIQPDPVPPSSPDPEPPLDVQPELPPRQPTVEIRPIEPPTSTAPAREAPLEIQPGPVPPASPEPALEPPVDVQPEPTPAAPLETRPQPPEPRPPVDVARRQPPAETAPVLPPAGPPATPAPRSESPAAPLPDLATIRPAWEAPLDEFLPSGRGSGHKLLARLGTTASTESCDSRQLPFFRVIETNVVPTRLPTGAAFSHRLIYALCPAEQDARATATVTRELRGGTGVVLTDATEGFGLRPGTWASDEELAVPPNTAPGPYTVTTTVTFDGSVWTEETDLLIE